jgi:hypothetical protein
MISASEAAASATNGASRTASAVDVVDSAFRVLLSGADDVRRHEVFALGVVVGPCYELHTEFPTVSMECQ